MKEFNAYTQRQAQRQVEQSFTQPIGGQETASQSLTAHTTDHWHNFK